MNMTPTHNLSEATARPIDQAANGAKSALQSTERVTRQAIDTLSTGVDTLRDRALRASDDAGDYIRTKPMQAMWMSAAMGAALMAVVALMSRSRR